ncbi:MAG: hypothetical protein J6386_15415 [Candidatus Synoicihabitans palmerolidicus]|nr:hypothetical protein [Candidatus Synoicihabitans palmerolidicus]
MSDEQNLSSSNRASAHGDEPITERRTLRDYAIILRERFWIALPLALLVSIGLGYYRSKDIPLYQSSATMRFEKPERVLDRSISTDAPTSAVDLNTYLHELSSGEMRNREIRSLKPDEIRILQRPYLKDLEPGQEPPSVHGALGYTRRRRCPRQLYYPNLSHSP